MKDDLCFILMGKQIDRSAIYLYEQTVAMYKHSVIILRVDKMYRNIIVFVLFNNYNWYFGICEMQSFRFTIRNVSTLSHFCIFVIYISAKEPCTQRFWNQNKYRVESAYSLSHAFKSMLVSVSRTLYTRLCCAIIKAQKCLWPQ